MSGFRCSRVLASVKGCATIVALLPALALAQPRAVLQGKLVHEAAAGNEVRCIDYFASRLIIVEGEPGKEDKSTIRCFDWTAQEGLGAGESFSIPFDLFDIRLTCHPQYLVARTGQTLAGFPRDQNQAELILIERTKSAVRLIRTGILSHSLCGERRRLAMCGHAASSVAAVPPATSFGITTLASPEQRSWPVFQAPMDNLFWTPSCVFSKSGQRVCVSTVYRDSIHTHFDEATIFQERPEVKEGAHMSWQVDDGPSGLRLYSYSKQNGVVATNVWKEGGHSAGPEPIGFDAAEKELHFFSEVAELAGEPDPWTGIFRIQLERPYQIEPVLAHRVTADHDRTMTRNLSGSPLLTRIAFVEYDVPIPVEQDRHYRIGVVNTGSRRKAELETKIDGSSLKRMATWLSEDELLLATKDGVRKYVFPRE